MDNLSPGPGLLFLRSGLLLNFIFFFSFLNKVYHARQIKSLANSIRVLADMEDPIGRVLKRTEVNQLNGV